MVILRRRTKPLLARIHEAFIRAAGRKGTGNISASLSFIRDKKAEGITKKIPMVLMRKTG